MKYILYGLITVLPVFVLPLFPAVFVSPKLALLAVGVSAAILVWAVTSTIKGSLSFTLGEFDLAVAILILSYLVSTFVGKINKSEAFFFPGALSFILAGGVLYFLINQIKKSEKDGVNFALVASGVLLSLAIIIGETKILPQIPSFYFDPLGGVIPTALYLIVISIILITLFIKQKDLAKRAFLGISTLLIVITIALSVKDAWPRQQNSPRFLSFKTSWEVVIDSLKENPLWGVGPGNYLTAFSKYRPLSYNQTEFWNVKFASASNFYFTLITEIGLAGFAAIGFLLFLVYKKMSIPVVTIMILFAILPASPILIVLMFVLLAISSEQEKTVEAATGKVSSGILTGIIVAGIATLAFFGSKAFAAEIKFKKALDSLAANNAKATYDNLASAVRLSPKVDRYHASYSQVDMALASSIAAKKNLTEADRNNISQLIQHAINEGKLTVGLNPKRSGNWETLARIYRSVMPFAQGADNFAIQTFSQAIALDPISPNLRIALGGTYFALGRFDEAIESFKLATIAKPDFGNAHYNLAVAYREKKEFKKATEEMNIVLSLVGKDSADYETAMKELKNIEDLTPPQPVEETNVKPPITLPEEATPPTTPTL